MTNVPPNFQCEYYILYRTLFFQNRHGESLYCVQVNVTKKGRIFFFFWYITNDTDLEGVVTYKQGTWIVALQNSSVTSVNTP